MKILLVDNNGRSRKTLKDAFLTNRIVPSADYIKEVSSPENLIETFKSFQPHIVLMEITFHEVNGLDLCLQLTGINPLCKIIITSNSKEPGIAEEAIRYGAVKFFSKPFQANHIISYIKSLHLDVDTSIEETDCSDPEDELFFVDVIDDVFNLSEGDVDNSVDLNFEDFSEMDDVNQKGVMSDSIGFPLEELTPNCNINSSIELSNTNNSNSCIDTVESDNLGGPIGEQLENNTLDFFDEEPSSSIEDDHKEPQDISPNNDANTDSEDFFDIEGLADFSTPHEELIYVNNSEPVEELEPKNSSDFKTLNDDFDNVIDNSVVEDLENPVLELTNNSTNDSAPTIEFDLDDDTEDASVEFELDSPTEEVVTEFELDVPTEESVTEFELDSSSQGAYSDDEFDLGEEEDFDLGEVEEDFDLGEVEEEQEELDTESQEYKEEKKSFQQQHSVQQRKRTVLKRVSLDKELVEEMSKPEHLTIYEKEQKPFSIKPPRANLVVKETNIPLEEPVLNKADEEVIVQQHTTSNSGVFSALKGIFSIFKK